MRPQQFLELGRLPQVVPGTGAERLDHEALRQQDNQVEGRHLPDLALADQAERRRQEDVDRGDAAPSHGSPGDGARDRCARRRHRAEIGLPWPFQRPTPPRGDVGGTRAQAGANAKFFDSSPVRLQSTGTSGTL